MLSTVFGADVRRKRALNSLVEDRTYQVADNRSVPARVYSVRQNSSELKVTIADLANTDLDETSVIDYAINAVGGRRGNLQHPAAY